MSSRLENLDIQEILFIFKKNIKLIIIFPIIAALAFFLVAKFFVRPKYEAKASLIVNAAKTTQTDMAQTYDAVQVSQILVNTYAIILKGNTILERVNSDLNLGLKLDQLNKMITISGESTTQVIDLSVKSGSRTTSMKIANEILEMAPKEIKRTVKAGSVAVISPVTADVDPVSPNIPFCIIVGLIIGLVIAICTAFIKEMMNDTFESDEDIQKYLGFNLLGVIPYVKSNK